MRKSTARRALVGAAAMAAAAGMSVGFVGPASAHTVTTSYNNACVALPSGYSNEHQVEPASVTVTHPAADTYRFQTGAQTTPSSAFGYTFKGLEKIRLVYSVDLSKFDSATIVPGTGSNYGGSPTVTLVGSKLVLEDAVSTSGVTVAPSTTYQLPQVEVKLKAAATDPGVRFDTAGTAGEYGNAANYFTFVSKATTWLGGAVSAPTRCIPANGPFTNTTLGTSPTLNAGAGALH